MVCCSVEMREDANVFQAGCENCGGSYIVSFRVEPYSLEKAKELGMAEISAGDGLKV